MGISFFGRIVDVIKRTKFQCDLSGGSECQTQPPRADLFFLPERSTTGRFLVIDLHGFRVWNFPVVNLPVKCLRGAIQSA